MPLNDVMSALGGAGQVLVAAVLAVVFLMLLLWILVPLTVLGLRGRVSAIRDDQRRVLTALREQQRTLNDMLGALIEEQQVTNDILAKITHPGEAESEPSAEPRPEPRRPSPAPEPAPSLDGRATDRSARPHRPLIADR